VRAAVNHRPFFTGLRENEDFEKKSRERERFFIEKTGKCK